MSCYWPSCSSTQSCYCKGQEVPKAQILYLGLKSLMGGECALLSSPPHILCPPLTGGQGTPEVQYFFGAMVKPSQDLAWPFGLPFFIGISHENFLRNWPIRTKFHIKLKEFDLHFSFGLLPSSKMAASESLQMVNFSAFLQVSQQYTEYDNCTCYRTVKGQYFHTAIATVS